jgi:hypothetical protein
MTFLCQMKGVHGNQLDFDKYKPRTKEEQAPGNPTFEVCRDTRDSLRQIADTAIGIGNVFFRLKIQKEE